MSDHDVPLGPIAEFSAAIGAFSATLRAEMDRKVTPLAEALAAAIDATRRKSQAPDD